MNHSCKLSIISTLLTVNLITIIGCAGENPTYSIHVRDRTGNNKYDQYYLSFQWSKTNIVAGSNDAIGLFNDPWPSKVTFRWEDGNGNQLANEDGELIEDHSVELAPIASDRWKSIKNVYICLKPDRQISVKAFTDQEVMEDQPVNKFMAGGQPVYSVGVKNNTLVNLANTSIRFGKYYPYPERIAPLKAPHEWNKTGWDFEDGNPFPVTDSAVVSWTTPDGLVHQQNIKMKGQLPKDLNGHTLCFIIEPDQTVKFQVRLTSKQKTWMNQGLIWKEP